MSGDEDGGLDEGGGGCRTKGKGGEKDVVLAIGVKDKYRPCWMGTTSEAS